MSINPWLLGLVVAIGSYAGCELANVREVAVAIGLFSFMNGFGAWLLVTVTKNLIAVLKGGHIRFY
ncbi:MAG TPA: hypothetical protein VNN10_10080 [Dehalococcoidia bacterium]|nr:hypothetical protein [Dehalococcoidia bacterium]